MAPKSLLLYPSISFKFGFLFNNSSPASLPSVLATTETSKLWVNLVWTKSVLEKGITWLREKVKKVDLDFYQKSDTSNPQRLKRCLEVYQNTGEKISSFYNKEKIKRNFKIIKIGISIEREKLYNKINQRVNQMIKDGLIDEAKKLFKYQKLNALNTVGYKELFDFFDNKTDIETAVEEIKKNSRRLAKRQITWFKRDKQINWFSLEKEDEIIKFTLES